MNFTGQDFARNSLQPAKQESGMEAGNYYAFFDKPIAENLAANQRGTLTPAQRRDIARRIAAHKTYVFFLWTLAFSGVLFIFFLVWKTDSELGVVSSTRLLVSGGIISILLGLFVLVLAGDSFLLFVPNDPGDDKVESTPGRVVWKGRRYGVHSDSHQLRSMRMGFALPPPGQYRFYYLSRTGLVVMAEELDEGATVGPESELMRVLARTNHFLLDDLIQNRQSLLSKNQQNRLALLFALDLLVVMSSAVLFVGSLFQVLGGNSSGLFYLLLILAAMLILRFGLSVARIIGDLWIGGVSSVEGPGARHSHQYRYLRSYYYVIGGQRFSVSKAAYNALIEGKPYRIYYAPHSRRLVSIELL
jgi:hypothetical protein